MTGWIWERNASGNARFLLATVGENPLVCFGINPSTASPNNLDPTVTRVSRFAEHNQFDSWMMLNIYPQISTDPRGMHPSQDDSLKYENERHISRLINNQQLTILAAWGTLIESRPYLRDAMRDIASLPELANCNWVSLGAPTKAGHPRHPLYVKGDTLLVDFDIQAYLHRTV